MEASRRGKRGEVRGLGVRRKNCPGEKGGSWTRANQGYDGSGEKGRGKVRKRNVWGEEAVRKHKD